jgi:hypothetical protein
MKHHYSNCLAMRNSDVISARNQSIIPFQRSITLLALSHGSSYGLYSSVTELPSSYNRVKPIWQAVQHRLWRVLPVYRPVGNHNHNVFIDFSLQFPTQIMIELGSNYKGLGDAPANFGTRSGSTCTTHPSIRPDTSNSQLNLCWPQYFMRLPLILQRLVDYLFVQVTVMKKLLILSILNQRIHLFMLRSGM